MVKAGGGRSIPQPQYTDTPGDMADINQQFTAMTTLCAAQPYQLQPHKGPQPDWDAGQQGGDISAGHGAE